MCIRDRNIALTRKVVEYAHDRNVTVEAELGRLAGVEDDVKVSAEDSSYTRPLSPFQDCFYRK